MLQIKNLLFLLFFLIFFHVKSQNLVPNPGFENTNGTPTCNIIQSKIEFNSCMQNWTIPTPGGTSDIYSTLVPISCYTNCFSTNSLFGTQAPRSGNNMCGFLLYGSPIGPIREYLQVKLTSPLIIGKKYYAEIYVCLAKKSIQGCNNIGMYFSDLPVTAQTGSGLMQYPAQIKTENVVTDTTNWTKISGTFIATTTAQYITIGNFNDDLSTSSIIIHQPAQPNFARLSYYYIDDVLVKNICNPKDKSATICKGNSITLKLNDDHVIGWSLASSPSTMLSNTSTITVFPQVNTTYIAHYDCGETSTYDVIVDTPIAVNLGNDTTICVKQKITLNALTENSSYTWQDGSHDPQFIVHTTGVYSVTVANSCGSVYDEIHINVDSPPSFTFGSDTTICKNEIMYFNAKTNNATYLWQDGSTSPSYIAKDTGIYNVTIINTCGTLNRSIRLSECCEGVTFPNLITPNGDGMNETFYIDCFGNGGYELAIYNTWGTLVYHNTAYLNNWNGNDVSDGLYYYVLKYKSNPINNGWIQVLR